MLLERVRSTIRRLNLINKGERVVVGVSGGPDSVTLLYLLNSLKKEFDLKLYAAHLDHMLRKDSARDAKFTAGLAERLKIPFTLGRINLKKVRKKGSWEENARNARLAFLFKAAGKFKARKIALGHNRDDQAETVLMRLLRGTGLYGLVGISPKRKFGKIEIIRPLIETSRREIEAFLKRKKIKPCLDRTNLSQKFLRNKIRHKLIPFLEQEYKGDIKESLANLAQSASFDYDYLQKQARLLRDNMRSRLNLKRLLRLHPAMRRLLLRSAICRVKGNMRRISLQHIKEIEELIFSRPINSIVDLPKGISAKKTKKTLVFYRR